jgi:hypothetical protein
MKLPTPVLFLALSGLGLSVSGGEFYQQFVSSVGTNEGYAGFHEYPFLVDTNNTGSKLTNPTLNLKSLRESAGISGVHLGMTMDEAIARWGKPPSGYGPMGCLHGLATFIYEDAALGFESNCLETIQFAPRAKMIGGLSRLSKPEDFVVTLGPPAERRTAGASCTLVYLSPSASLRLDFHEDELVNIWLERTPSRAAPWKQNLRANPQGGANERQPVQSETNRTPAAAASRRSP